MIDKNKFFNLMPRIESAENVDGVGEVFVKSLTVSERDEYEVSVAESSDNKRRDTRALLIIATACDKDGSLIFDKSDIEMVRKIPARAVQAMFNKSMDLNIFSNADIEELEEN